MSTRSLYKVVKVWSGYGGISESTQLGSHSSEQWPALNAGTELYKPLHDPLAPFPHYAIYLSLGHLIYYSTCLQSGLPASIVLS